MSPNSARELADEISKLNARAEKAPVVDLQRMNRVIELAPEDMTVTVESGITLGALRKELAAHRQWLPVDPPHSDTISIHDILSRDLSGPRRFGYGTIREHLIGMKVVLADGRVIKSGGKVVKNVAGYDIAKLFIGARGSLGIIVEAAFKVRPLPDVERIVSMQTSVATAGEVLRSILDSDLTPIILDLYQLESADAASIVIGFAGTRSEAEWQLEIARAMGLTNDTTLEYETQFWSNSAPVNRLSVLPSRLPGTLVRLSAESFVARAGNGIIYFRSETTLPCDEIPLTLMRRIKSAFDPKNIFPEFSL